MSSYSTPLILASTSQPRKMLLQRLQIPFAIANPNADETPLAHEAPDKLALRLAEAKARAVAHDYPDALIIGADQVGVLNGMLLGKPGNYATAVQQLQQASGQLMKFYIGLCLLDTRTGTMQIGLDEYSVLFRNLSLATIEQYLSKEQPLQCAGSCKAEGLGITLIEKFIGDDFSALIGLPLIRLTSFLTNAGLSPLASF